MLAKTPKPPYYAVIFSNFLSEDTDGYEATAQRMVELASQQTGFLGMESARGELGITVSYWSDLQAIRNWRQNAEHSLARETGRKRWYREFCVRIARVEREYGFPDTV